MSEEKKDPLRLRNADTSPTSVGEEIRKDPTALRTASRGHHVGLVGVIFTLVGGGVSRLRRTRG